MTRKTTEELLRDEHDEATRTRMVNTAPVFSLAWDEDNNRTFAPIVIATSNNAAVSFGSGTVGFDPLFDYKVRSDVDLCIAVMDTGDAGANDYYMPAGQEFIYRIPKESAGRLSLFSKAVGSIWFSRI